MSKDNIYIAVTENYKILRDNQTSINRFVWSTELCYRQFLNNYENRSDLFEIKTSEIFSELPLQAWFKNSNGLGKYDLTLKDHNEIIKQNQLNIWRSAIINFNSYFDEYLKERLSIKDSPFFLFYNLDNEDLFESNIKIRAKTIFESDCCRQIRNIIVHTNIDKELSIDYIKKEINNRIVKNLPNQSQYLKSKYTFKEIKDTLESAICRVIDTAENEVSKAATNGVILPLEFFFLIFTFTNYNNIALEIEQSLYRDSKQKNAYTRIDRATLNEFRLEMIREPSVTGTVYNIETNEPVVNAKIIVLDFPANSETDKNGSYYLTPNLATGIYSMEISASGFKKKTIELSTVKDYPIIADVGIEAL